METTDGAFAHDVSADGAVFLFHGPHIGISERCAVAAATEVMYDAIEARIDALASRPTYPCRHLVIIGGVLINSDFDVGSFCCFRRLIYIDQENSRCADWLPALLA